ncbi:hypothetical protein PHMEG_00014180, partial [Phytophthora megakarya]
VPHEQFEHIPVAKLTSKEAGYAFCMRCSCKVNYSHGATTPAKVHMQRYHMDTLSTAK